MILSYYFFSCSMILNDVRVYMVSQNIYKIVSKHNQAVSKPLPVHVKAST